MRRLLAFALTVLTPLLGFAQALAAPPKLAVFDFELVDTSLQGEVYGTRPAEQERLQRVTDLLRAGLKDSGKFDVLDVAPVRDAAHAANLQACGGCDQALADKLGADLVVTGMVQKVSELILSMKIWVRDVHTGKIITQMNADFRGNTDESWTRAANYLLRNRLLAPDYGVPH
ncbi:DUF3280 domain-containing protein [Bradyrhizobium sp. WD16]|uniref:DUF3280 domain-containing protein n=1 Tax=Bradyrhizobium sp. WD16 TaxID=1521768 RepID=UPI0020A2C4B8|nr:DUF3280 domain-containing protein [Bradyrhizobium sp. WD16]UTD28109.1 hypothetical protein DB459_15610 [Bradyrhizobium sp. WD16]